MLAAQFISCMALLVSGAVASPPPVVSINGSTIYSDKARSIEIQYAQTPFDTVIFSSRLPEGWTFGIDVDGDQNGVWGAGHGMPDPSIRTSPDRSFGQASKNGVLCSQYVFTSLAADPREIQIKSDCADPISSGRVILSGYGADNRANIMLEIPAAELFGTRASAHVQICVWDTVRWSCQHKLPKPLVLTRASPVQSK